MKRNLTIIIILSVLIGVTILLLYFNFKDAYLLNLPQTDEITVELLEKEIEYSLDLGIDINKYYGMDKVVDDFVKHYELSDGVVILDLSQNVVYSTTERYVDYEYLIKDIEKNYVYRANKDGFSAITVLDGGGIAKGYIINFIDSSKINKVIYGYLLKSIAIYIGVILTYLRIFRNKITKENILKNAIIMQSIVSVVRIFVYYNTIKNSVMIQLGYTLEILKDKLNVVTDYKIPLENINGVDAFVDSVARRIDAFENIQLIIQNNMIDFKYNISSQYILKLLGSSIIDTLVLSILLTFLLLEVINIYWVTTTKKESHNPQVLRSFSFVYFLGYYCSVMFVPLRMLELIGGKENIFSTEVMMGLPVSLEAIIVAITAVGIVKIVEKRGFRSVFSLGILMTMSGYYLSYMTKSPYGFIISRMIMGFGHGICLIVMRGYVVSNPNASEIGEGVTSFGIGVFSSLNIGCVIGGIIGDYFGLKYAFLISGILMAIPGINTAMFVSDRIMPKRTTSKFTSDFITILKEHRLIIGILLFMAPLRILSGYLEFFFPVVASKNLSWSFSDISKGYLLNSMIIILAGLNLVRFLSRRLNLVKRLYLGIFIMMGSVLIMGALNNSVGMILSIVCLSVALAFMEGNFLEYYTNFNCTKAIGSMKSMSFYTLFDRGIMYLVPYIYALVLSGNTGVNLVIMIGILGVGMMILFWVLKRFAKEGEMVKSVTRF